MPRKPGPNKVRVQLDLLSGAYEELIQLQEVTNSTSLVETIRYALRTLQWIAQAIRGGSIIVVEKDGKQQQVVFPFISTPVREQEVVSL